MPIAVNFVGLKRLCAPFPVIIPAVVARLTDLNCVQNVHMQVGSKFLPVHLRMHRACSQTHAQGQYLYSKECKPEGNLIAPGNFTDLESIYRASESPRLLFCVGSTIDRCSKGVANTSVQQQDSASSSSFWKSHSL